MALVLTNPNGRQMLAVEGEGGYQSAPYCPEGAAVVPNPTLTVRVDMYSIRRGDWGASYSHINERKRRIARVLSPHTYDVTTHHDRITGQLVSVRIPQPFGTPDPVVVRSSTAQHTRKTDRRQRLTQMREQILDDIEDDSYDTQSWAEKFYDMYDALSISGMDRLTKLIESNTNHTATDCDRCEHKAFHLEDVRVTRRDSQTWCLHCTESDAQWLDRNDEYVDNDQVVSVDNDAFYVPIWHASDNYYEDDNGDWHSEPQNCDDEDDGEDDGDDDNTAELHNYHATKSLLRGWTMAPDGHPNVSTGCWAPMTIGIELEVEAEGSRYDTVAPLVCSLRDIIGQQSLFAEKDGSLDDNLGFELIFGWSDLPSWQRAMPRIGTALKEGEVISHDAGVHYGLHVNVAVINNIFVQSAITWFINHNDNAKLLFALARREPTPFCPREHGRHSPSTYHNAAVNFGDTAGVFKAPSAGTNVDCNSKIASFRLFRGTINPVRLMADIEFCHSLVSAATAYSYTLDGPLEAGTFNGFTMRYWQTHVLKNITRYPTLVNYLRQWDKRGTQMLRTNQHGVFTDRAMTRFISQYPMGALTGATHDGLDKRALALLNNTIASTEE